MLIRPQMGENIGAVARAMANFGLRELRIVSPRDGWPNPAAEAMATGGAAGILQGAKIYDSNEAAFADITRAYATTARPRELEKRVLTPGEAISEICHTGEGRYPCHSYSELPDVDTGLRRYDKVAIVFGPERTGLENDDLAWCETIVTIPTSEHASLNIAQAAVVMAYEWFTHSSKFQAPSSEDTSLQLATYNSPLGTLSEYDNLFRQLEAYLDAADFFKVPQKKPVMLANIKAMLLRGRFTSQEIRTVHGILRALAESGKGTQ
ncbi:MAG: RNA methyltransferase [Alphaproteobacteria bacterium]|nr:RNA methyltransferase [Alphaproteobacteria bacterium]